MEAGEVMRMPEQSRTIIVCDGDKCTGCECCILACSGGHFRVFSPANARIWVEEKEPVQIKAFTCQQCKIPACLEACPMGAIRKKEGLVMVDEEECIGCGACVRECPFGAIVISSISGKAIKCDMCDGDPECIKSCIHEALSSKEVVF
jgi:Fe-S-cluster-containing hydrogenase component 2